MRALKSTISAIDTENTYIIGEHTKIYLTKDKKYFVFVDDNSFDDDAKHAHYFVLTETVKMDINSHPSNDIV